VHRSTIPVAQFSGAGTRGAPQQLGEIIMRAGCLRFRTFNPVIGIRP
jgi:hypothetical protein